MAAQYHLRDHSDEDKLCVLKSRIERFLSKEIVTHDVSNFHEVIEAKEQRLNIAL